MSITASVTIKTVLQNNTTNQVSTYEDVNGPMVLNTTTVEDIVLPASTSLLQLPFPPGMSTAKLVILRAVGAADLTVQLSLAAGSTVFAVPKDTAQPFYNAPAIYVSSALGGAIQFIAGY